jgi:hypothetical protein
MMQVTREQVKVAEAVLGDVAIEFYQDGSAVMAAALTMECRWCGALHDLEGERVRFAPDLAWHLLQAARQHLTYESFRQAGRAIMAAISGPQD